VDSECHVETIVERELVLRLASILWRLRRATTMETGLFEIQAQRLHDYRQDRQLLSNSREVIRCCVAPDPPAAMQPHSALSAT
jgi:hypothetical protein